MHNANGHICNCDFAYRTCASANRLLMSCIAFLFHFEKMKKTLSRSDSVSRFSDWCRSMTPTILIYLIAILIKFRSLYFSFLYARERSVSYKKSFCKSHDKHQFSDDKKQGVIAYDFNDLY